MDVELVRVRHHDRIHAATKTISGTGNGNGGLDGLLFVVDLSDETMQAIERISAEACRGSETEPRVSNSRLSPATLLASYHLKQIECHATVDYIASLRTD